VRFEVFMVVEIQVDFLWVVIPHSFDVGYQCFTGPCYLHFQALHSITTQKTSYMYQW